MQDVQRDRHELNIMPLMPRGGGIKNCTKCLNPTMI